MTDSWSVDVYGAIKDWGISLAVTVPDGGLANLLHLLEADSDVRVVTLATEEEGVAMVCGAWLGGTKGVLLMQSSGVGNTVNMLSLPKQCQIPFLAVVTMRGGPEESNPWQIHMGKAASEVLNAMGITPFPVSHRLEVGQAFDEAAAYAFNGRMQSAVLIDQQIIGAKKFQGD